MLNLDPTTKLVSEVGKILAPLWPIILFLVKYLAQRKLLKKKSPFSDVSQFFKNKFFKNLVKDPIEPTEEDEIATVKRKEEDARFLRDSVFSQIELMSVQEDLEREIKIKDMEIALWKKEVVSRDLAIESLKEDKLQYTKEIIILRARDLDYARRGTTYESVLKDWDKNHNYVEHL